MILDKDSERRRLRKTETTMWVILLSTIVACVTYDRPVMLGLLCFDGFVFSLMLQQVRRDISSLTIKGDVGPQ